MINVCNNIKGVLNTKTQKGYLIPKSTPGLFAKVRTAGIDIQKFTNEQLKEDGLKLVVIPLDKDLDFNMVYEDWQNEDDNQIQD